MVEQRYKSASTSIRKPNIKLAKILAKHFGKNGDVVLDYGGGKYDTATDYLAKFGIVNYIYDPFNRSEMENRFALERFGYDFVMLSNVLNVIAEGEVRNHIIKKTWEYLKPDGKLLVKIYEGDRSGILKANEKRNSCQMNRDLKFYFWEVIEVFGLDKTEMVWLDGKQIIVATK